MAERLVECVPNISAGREREQVERILSDLAATNVSVLHVDIGEDANRTVFTYVGSPADVLEGSFALVESAAKHIDMQMHHGEHPRSGAVDVLPFVPLSGVDLAECVQLAKILGQRVSSELGLPVYLYEAAASAPHRRNLADVRRGEYEGLAQKLREPEWLPDFGPIEFQPRFGALITGAREFLAAFNVNLVGADGSAARKIAAMVREKGAGSGPHLAGVKAIGWYMERYGCWQVSMNLTRLEACGLAEAYEACRKCAGTLGVEVRGSELIGMIPKQVMLRAGQYYEGSQTLAEGDLISLAVTRLGLSALANFEPSERILELALESKLK